MGNLLKPSLFILLCVCISCRQNPSGQENWQTLFNGTDLSGWDTFLGPSYDTVKDQWDTVPIGFNMDPAKVFTIVDMDGEKAIRISGQYFGGISTDRDFQNYHLQLQFKWGQLKWAPREKDKRDSGLMYHSVGAHGADGGFWMRSHEFQIQEGDCGDYWACAGAVADVKATMNTDSNYVYNENAILMAFSQASPAGRRCIKDPDAEKPSGEWNTLDLYCVGNTSVHIVNGVVTMVLHNSRQIEDKSEVPLTEGKILLQSEGAEVYYRHIRLSPTHELPSSLAMK